MEFIAIYWVMHNLFLALLETAIGIIFVVKLKGSASGFLILAGFLVSALTQVVYASFNIFKVSVNLYGVPFIFSTLLILIGAILLPSKKKE